MYVCVLVFVLLHAHTCVVLATRVSAQFCVSAGAPHETAEGGSDEGEGDLREGGSQGIRAGEEGKGAVTSHHNSSHIQCSH